jgi:hypothetical protein
MRLRKAFHAKAMPGLLRKCRESKSRDFGMFPCDLVFDYVAIKAERSDLTRTVRLADFNDGRPFVLSSAGIAARQELTQSWPPSAPAFTGPVLEYP